VLSCSEIEKLDLLGQGGESPKGKQRSVDVSSTKECDRRKMTEEILDHTHT